MHAIHAIMQTKATVLLAMLIQLQLTIVTNVDMLPM
jgi:hypothetical protein